MARKKFNLKVLKVYIGTFTIIVKGALLFGNISGGNRNFHKNPYKQRQKNRLNLQKKIIHVDDMVIHNLIKYFVQIRLRL